MPSSENDTSRRISWDLVRVLAVLSVMLGHVTHQGPLAHPELDGYPFRVTAQFGAVALLVVSAYFVCETVRRGRTGRWLWRKVARLVPPYLVAVVFTYLVMRMADAAFNGQRLGGGWFGTLFGLPAALPAQPTSWYVPIGRDLLINLGMLQGWIPAAIWLDGSYWTLPVQIMAFTAAAVLWSRSRRFGTGRALVMAWALIIGPLVARFWVLDPGHDAPWGPSVVFGFGLHRTHAFAAGIGIWLWARNRMTGRHLALLLAVAVVAQDLQLYPLHRELPGDPARFPSDIGFAATLLAICAAAKGPDWTVFRPLAPVIRWLAGISYGVYLLHQELGYILAKVLLELGATGWERLVAVLTAATVAGWLLTVLVERPAHQWLTRRRKPAPPPPDSVPEQRPTGPAPISVGGPS